MESYFHRQWAGYFKDARHNNYERTASFLTVLTVFVQIVIYRRQAKIMGAQADIARQTHVAFHRPKIIMRDPSLDNEGGINYMLINIGSSEAHIVESWIFAEYRFDASQIRNPRPFGHDDLGRLKFSPGEMRDLVFQAPAEVGIYFKFRPNITSLKDDPNKGMPYFMGAITYEDMAGNRRRSVFCRRWDHQRQGFYRTDDPDHEYAD